MEGVADLGVTIVADSGVTNGADLGVTLTSPEEREGPVPLQIEVDSSDNVFICLQEID